MMPTRAMVLAAGLGARMQPLTSRRAKPVLPVLNRPLVAHALERLASHGVRLVVVNSHHHPAELERLVARWAPEGVDVRFSRERELLGTAGGLRKAARYFGRERFFLVNSDSLTDADLAAAVAAHEESGRAATMIVMAHDPGSGYRPVQVASGRGGTARVAGIAGRSWPPGSGAKTIDRTFTGIHILEPSVLDAIPAAGPCDINAEVYPKLLDADPEAVGAWLHEGWWFEAGNPARYLELNLTMLARTGRSAVVGPGFFIDEEASVSASVLGEGVRVQRGASVSGSVLWDNVTLGEGVSLQGCIVTDGVTLPSFARWSASIIMQTGDGMLAVQPLEGVS